MRLFIAIDLPENIKTYLRQLQAILFMRCSHAKHGEGAPDANMSRTHNFHITLKFLGECIAGLRIKTEEQLKQIKFQPFEAELGGIDVFGGRHPSVVWVGVSAPNKLNELACELDNRMKKLGFRSENAFIPHVTLARVKFIKNPEDFLERLKKIKIEPLKFKIEKFYLFESRLSATGATHIKLAEFGR